MGEGETRGSRDATVQLTILERKFVKLKDEGDNMKKAKEARELAEPGKTKNQ